MSSHFRIAAIGWMILATAASAQPANNFFEQSSHDFGSVQRGPMLTHYYRLTNTTNQPLHIAGVRVSCGCVAASAVKDTLAPGESSAIYATMDTRRFTGPKQVTIYVTFDRPMWHEVALSVSAYGRDDMSLETETMSFGPVARGAASSVKMNVTLRQANWAVQQVGSDSAFVIPKVREVRRTQTDVVYEVSAELKPGLPTGRWTTDIHLTTNSPVSPRISLPVSVEIRPALSVTPGEVTFNSTTVGQPSETKLVIKGGQPFKIKEIQGLDGTLTVANAADESKPVHILTVKFDPTQEGSVIKKLRIVTDLPAEGVAEVAIKGQATKK